MSGQASSNASQKILAALEELRVEIKQMHESNNTVTAEIKHILDDILIKIARQK